MKKRRRIVSIISILLVLIFTFALPVFASSVSSSSGESEQAWPYLLLMDDAGILDEEEAGALLAKLEQISANQKMDVAVVTVAHMDGRSVEDYTDDFYDAFGYGQGSSRDGVMLLVAMEERAVHMTAVGEGIRAFTDDGRAYILDECVMPWIRDGEYAKAFDAFADQCDAFLTQAKTGKPYDGSFMPKGEFQMLDLEWLVGAVIAGGIITWCVCTKLKKQMKTVEFQHAANSYAVSGSLVITGQSDQFITTHTSRTPREKSSGGGSSTHTSSSGTTHSGSSRDF